MDRARHRGRGARARVQGRPGRRRHRPDGRARRDLRLPRPERRRQVDDRPHADDAAPAHRGHGAASPASTSSRTARRSARRSAPRSRRPRSTRSSRAATTCACRRRSTASPATSAPRAATSCSSGSGSTLRGRPQGAHVLGRDEAAPRPGARACPPPTAPLPRRADHGPRPAEPQRPLAGGRPAGEGGGRDRLPDHAVPRGGRRARRPGRDHRPRPDRRRGHAGRAEGRDRPPDRRGRPRRPGAARPRRRHPRAASASSSRSRPTASPSAASTARSTSPRSSARSTPRTSTSRTSSSTRPSLDDVFLEKTGRTLEGAAAEAEAERGARRRVTPASRPGLPPRQALGRPAGAPAGGRRRAGDLPARACSP